MARVTVDIQGTYLRENFKGVALSGEGSILHFVDCTFDDCTFDDCTFDELSFTGCTLRTSHFSGRILDKLTIKNSWLWGVCMNDMHIELFKMRNAHCLSVDMINTRIGQWSIGRTMMTNVSMHSLKVSLFHTWDSTFGNVESEMTVDKVRVEPSLNHGLLHFMPEFQVVGEGSSILQRFKTERGTCYVAHGHSWDKSSLERYLQHSPRELELFNKLEEL